jgi:hypothetical protein
MVEFPLDHSGRDFHAMFEEGDEGMRLIAEKLR